MEILGSAHDEIHRERRRHGQANTNRLIVLVPRGHDDKNVHIAIGMRRAIGVRTKQNDFVRLKLLSDPAREAADHLKRYIRPAVAALRRLR